LTLAGLVRKKAVLFSTGSLDSALSHAELDSLSECLGTGLSLFISGRNFVERNDSSDFLLNRAHTVFAANSNVNSCRGVQNELLTGLSSFTIGASFPRDSMYVTSSQAHPVLEYSIIGPRGTAAVRVDGDSATGKLVLLGFPFEGITASSTRMAILQRAIGYFDGSIVAGVDDPFGVPGLEPRLEQNYPNPFNPTTTIGYRVSGSGNVSLRVFNILGQEVRTLVNERKDAGVYKVVFNSDGLPSGVYVYRLQSGGVTRAGKMVLLK
jgi:hypothetical protein